MTEKTGPILNINGLAKSYGSVQALASVSLSVNAGSVVALLGPNGAGKTTLLKCILGVTDFEGSIEVAGFSVKRYGKQARYRIGYLPQMPAFSHHDTCQEALTFLADLRGIDRQRIGSVLSLVKLDERSKEYVGNLSGGMRQRLALAAALLSEPPLLLLDEPTASLDFQSRREFYDLIASLRDAKRTIIISTHLLESLDRLADRVIMLNQGRLVFEGPIDDITRLAETRRYVVNLNGTTPSAFFAALRSAGIGLNHVRPAESTWEDVLLTASNAAIE